MACTKKVKPSCVSRRSAVSKADFTPVLHLLRSEPVDEFVNSEHAGLGYWVSFHTAKSQTTQNTPLQARVRLRPRLETVSSQASQCCCFGAHLSVIALTPAQMNPPEGRNDCMIVYTEFLQQDWPIGKCCVLLVNMQVYRCSQ